MLSEKWIDPRVIDWTSGLNGLRVPGWTRNNNPYAWQAITDVFTQALDKARGIETRIYVGPEKSAQLIPANQTIDYEVPSEPNFWMWGINASALPVRSEGQPTNFLFNVMNSETGVPLFSSPMPMKNFNAAVAGGPANRGPICLLSTPQLYASPAYPIIRIINVNPDGGTEDLTCRVTLFGCVEYDQ